jgi:hypothetical protein
VTRTTLLPALAVALALAVAGCEFEPLSNDVKVVPETDEAGAVEVDEPVEDVLDAPDVAAEAEAAPDVAEPQAEVAEPVADAVAEPSPETVDAEDAGGEDAVVEDPIADPAPDPIVDLPPEPAGPPDGCDQECVTALCGNCTCDPWEDAATCKFDCGWCGDGLCGCEEQAGGSKPCPNDCTT